MDHLVLDLVQILVVLDHKMDKDLVNREEEVVVHQTHMDLRLVEYPTVMHLHHLVFKADEEDKEAKEAKEDKEDKEDKEVLVVMELEMKMEDPMMKKAMYDSRKIII